MNIIKTPTGIVPVDEPAHVLTQEEYDALPEQDKVKGTYYISDDTEDVTEGEMLMAIGAIGKGDISLLGDGTLTGAVLYLDKKKANQTDLNATDVRVDGVLTSMQNLTDTVDAALNKIKDMKVGTRNLALGTNNGIDGWHFQHSTGDTTITEYIDGQTKCAKLTVTATPLGISYLSFEDLHLNLFRAKRKYYISFMVYSDIDSGATIAISNSVDGDVVIPTQTVTTFCKPNTWTTVTLMVDSTDSFIITNQILKIIPTATLTAGDYFIIKDLIITDSSIAVDYTIAPEDFLKKISSGSEGGGGEGGDSDKFNQIDQRISELSGKITGNTSSISSLSENKADKAELVSINSDITALQDSKADKSVITEVSSKVDEHTKLINDLETSKANASDLTGMANDIQFLTDFKLDTSTFTNYKSATDTLITTNKNDITNLKAQKANQSDLVTLTDAVNTLKTSKANQSDLDILQKQVDDNITDNTELLTRLSLAESNIDKKADATDLVEIRSDINTNASAITALNTSKATVQSVNELKASIATNTEEIEKRALNTTVDELATKVQNNANGIDSLGSAKANQTDVEALSTKVSINTTNINAMNAHMYYSTYAGDGETDVFITPTFDVATARGCLFIFGAPDSDAISSGVIHVRNNTVFFKNLGDLEVTVSLEEGKVKVSGVTSNMRYFVIEA